MGMDYVGRNGEVFHLNWAGHRFVYALLRQLAADLSEWSGSNEGDYISANTCKSWATLLRGCVDKLRIIKIPNERCHGGYLKMPLVEGKTLEDELSNGFTRELIEIERSVSKFFGKTYTVDASAIKVEPADEEFKQWILNFAGFLERCRGCWQY